MTRNIKAKVVAKTTVYDEPREVGAIVEVDEITFRNLEKKGRLTLAVEAEQPEEKPEAGKGKGKKSEKE